MKSKQESATRGLQRERVEEAWRELLEGSLRRGFYGTVSVEVSLQDGAIQHLRRRVERLEK